MLRNLILIVLAFQCSPLFAMGKQQQPVPFDYSAFSGHFEPVAPCTDAGFDLVADPAKNKVVMLISDSPAPDSTRAIFIHDTFENINQGKSTFNSCWSDGVLGYSVTKGEGTKIVKTTVYQSPGFFCGGGSEKHRSLDVLQLEGSLLTWTIKWSNFDSVRTCTFARK